MEDREEISDEINLLDYINVITKHKRLIIVIIAFSVIVTGIVSFLLPKIYEAKAVIIPVNPPNERPEGMGSIAMQFGISTPPTLNTAEIVSLLKSNILMEKVIKRYNLITVFFGKELKEKTEAEKIWDGIRYLKENIYKVKDNKKEGIIELAAEFKEPKTSANILNYILTELTDYMSSEAKRVAETNKEYLESLIDKNADPLIRQKIYSLIANQIETSMLAEVKENFAFKIIDPPKVPDKKIKPRIAMNIIVSFFISLFAGVFTAFFIEYVENVRKRERM
jgi:uncharacterized protein involved in exopolysaccharide biosynthesis